QRPHRAARLPVPARRRPDRAAARPRRRRQRTPNPRARRAPRGDRRRRRPRTHARHPPDHHAHPAQGGSAMSSNPVRPTVPHRGITTLLALVAPTAVLTAAAVLTWSWRTDLPNPVAVHWGTGDGPDGFASLTSSLATMAIIGVLMAV